MTKRTLIVEVLPKGFKELESAVDKLGSSSSSATKSIKAVGAAAKDADDKLSAYAKRFRLYTDNLKAYAKEISSISQAMKSLSLPTASTGPNFKDFSASLKDAANSFERIQSSQKASIENEIGLQKIAQAIEATKQAELRTMRALIDAEDKLESKRSRQKQVKQVDLSQQLKDSENQAFKEGLEIVKEVERIRKEAAAQRKAESDAAARAELNNIRQVKDAFSAYDKELKISDKERAERRRNLSELEKSTNSELRAFQKEFNASLAETINLERTKAEAASASAAAAAASAAAIKRSQSERLKATQDQIKAQNDLQRAEEAAQKKSIQLAADARAALRQKTAEAEKARKAEEAAARAASEGKTTSLRDTTKSLQDKRLADVQERLRLEKEIAQAKQKSADVDTVSDKERIARLADIRAQRQKELEDVRKIVEEEKARTAGPDSVEAQRLRIKRLEDDIDRLGLRNKERELELTQNLLKLEERRARLTAERGSKFSFEDKSAIGRISDGFELANVNKRIRDTSKELRDLEKETNRGRIGLLDFANVARVAVGNIIAITSTEIIFGFRRLVENIIQATSTLQDFANKIRLVTAEYNSLSVTQAKLFELSKETRTSFGGTVEIFTRMARATESLNISQERLFRITETVNKATIISGANAREAEQGLIQLAQGIASNRLSGDEFRSISEQLPEITRIIADSLGVTRGQLRLLASEGALTAEVIIKALEGAAEEVDAKFGKTVKTIGQSFEILKTTLLERLNQDIEKISSAVIGATDFLTNNLDSIINALGLLIKLLEILAARLLIGAVIGKFAKDIRSIGDAFAFAQLQGGVLLANLKKFFSSPLNIAVVIAPALLTLLNMFAKEQIDVKVNIKAVSVDKLEEINRLAHEDVRNRIQGVPEFLGQSKEALKARAVLFKKFYDERIAQEEAFNRRVKELAAERVTEVKKEENIRASSFTPVGRVTTFLFGKDAGSSLGSVATNTQILLEKLLTGESKLAASIKSRALTEAKLTAERETQEALAQKQAADELKRLEILEQSLRLTERLGAANISIAASELSGLTTQQLDEIRSQLTDIEADIITNQEKFKASSEFEAAVIEKKISLLKDVKLLGDDEVSLQEKIAEGAARVLTIYEKYQGILSNVLSLQQSGVEDFKKSLEEITRGLSDEGRVLSAELSGGESLKAKVELDLQFESELKDFQDEIQESLDDIEDLKIHIGTDLNQASVDALRDTLNQNIATLEKQAKINLDVAVSKGGADSQAAKDAKTLVDQVNTFKTASEEIKSLDVSIQLERLSTVLRQILGLSAELTEQEKERADQVRKTNEALEKQLNLKEHRQDVRNLEAQIEAAKISEEALEIQEKFQELKEANLGLSDAELKREAEKVVMLERQLDLINAGNKARTEANKKFSEDIKKLREDFEEAVGRQAARARGGETGERIFEVNSTLENIFKDYAEALSDTTKNTKEQIEENKKLIETKRKEIDALKALVPSQVRYLEVIEQIADVSENFQNSLSGSIDRFFDTLVRKPKDAFKELFSSLADGFKQLAADVLKILFDPLKQAFKDFAADIAKSILNGEGLGSSLGGGLKNIFKSLKDIGGKIGGIFGEGGAEIGGAALPAAAGGLIANKIVGGLANLIGLKKGSNTRQFLVGAGTAGGVLAGAALAGLGVGGPIGLIAGVIIGGLVNLFRGKPSNKFARGSLDLGSLVTGNFQRKDDSEATQENVDALNSLFDGLSSVISEFKKFSGASFIGDLVIEVNRRNGIVVGTGGFAPGGGPANSKTFKDPDEAFRYALSVALSQSKNADPIFSGFLNASIAAKQSAEQISENLSKLGSSLEFLKEPTSQWKAALDNLNQVFQPLIANSASAAQATAAYNQALQKVRDEFVKEANKQELALTNPVAAQFADLLEIQSQRISDAIALGTQQVLDAAKSLNAAEISNFVDNLASGLDSIIESLDPFTVNETVEAIHQFKEGFMAVIEAAQAAGADMAATVDSLTTQLDAKLNLLRSKFDQSVSDALLGEDNPEALQLRQILREQAESIEIANELGANVDNVLTLTANRIKDLIDAAASDPESLVNLAEGLADLIDEMQQAGQEIGPVIEAFAAAQQKVVQAFNDSVTDRILEITQPTLQAFKALLTKQQAELNIATQIGADPILLHQAQALERKQFLDNLSDEELTSLGDFLGLIEDYTGKIAVVIQELNNLFEEQVENFKDSADAAFELADAFKAAADNIRSTIDNIENQYGLGPPAEKLANLRTQFQSAFESAQLGDKAALEKLPELGQQIIDQSRGLFGGTQQFQTDLDFVLGILKTSERIALQRETEERARGDAILAQVDLLKEIRDLLAQQNLDPAELAALIQQVNPANTEFINIANQLLQLISLSQQDLGGVGTYLQDEQNAQTAINQLFAAAGLTPPTDQLPTPTPIDASLSAQVASSAQTGTATAQTEQNDNLAIIVALTEETNEKLESLMSIIRFETTVEQDSEREMRRVRAALEKFVNEQTPQQSALLRSILEK